MLILIVLTSSLFYTLSSAQTSTTVGYPILGPITAVPNNDPLLNFTIIYPPNYQFDQLFVRFTMYDFVSSDKLNPQIYPSFWLNFTNSNTSLPWLAPSVPLIPGDYVIVCFEWVQTNNSGQWLVDTNQCILTRASLNSTILPISTPVITAPVVSNTALNISTYYPTILPYDQVNITCTLNDTTLPSMVGSSSNDTYMVIDTFSFINLIPYTSYNICIYINYANSIVNGSQNINSQCQTTMTLGAMLANTTANPATNPPNPTSALPPGNSSNKVTSKLAFIILFFIFASI